MIVPKFNIDHIRYGDFHKLVNGKEPAKCHEEYKPINDKDEEHYVKSFLNLFIEKYPQMTKEPVHIVEKCVYCTIYKTDNMAIYHYMILDDSNDINYPDDDIMLFIKDDEYLYFGTECSHGFYSTKNIIYFESDGSTYISIGNSMPLGDKLKIVKDELYMMLNGCYKN